METPQKTPLFLSHHPQEESERCVSWRGYFICRRCIFLYPCLLFFVGFSFSPWIWPVGWDPYLLWLLPIPATLEFVLEQLRFIPYHPMRQIFVTVLFTPALGRGFARYFVNQADPLFWEMVLFFGGICFSAWLYRKRYL